MILNDIPTISNFLKTGRTKNVKLLHQIIFILLLIELVGRAYKILSNLSEKKKVVLKNFILSDIIVVCISLNLDTSGNKEQLIEQIFSFLFDLNMLYKNETTIIHDTDEESLQTSKNLIDAATGASQEAVFISGNENCSQDYFFFI